MSKWLQGLRRSIKEHFAPPGIADYWGGVMAIAEGTRLNITKDFRYMDGFRGEHFQGHLDCLLNGIRYKWLVYDSTMKESASEWGWVAYMAAVSKGLQARGYKANPFEASIPGKGDPQVEMRKIASIPRARQIPWRVTLFEDEIGLSMPEPTVGSYGVDRTTILFDRASTKDLGVLYKTLWQACRANEPDLERIKRAHREYKTAFLNYFSQNIHVDVPADRMSASVRVNAWVLLATLALVVAAAVTLVYALFR